MGADSEPMCTATPTAVGLPHGRALVRFAAIAVGLFTVAMVCGAGEPVAGLLVSATLLAVVIERKAMHREAAARLQVVARSARAEGERDALARAMSLEMAYERSRSVLEALSEGVVVVDDSGEIVLANPAASRAMRSPRLDPAGAPLWDALMPELGQRAREAWQALVDPARSAEELPSIRYSGIPCRDVVYDLAAVRAVSPRTGQEFGCVFLLVDSTRTFELQRLKDSFLSSVSHELRTPLTNICAYAEILRHMLPGESAEWPEFVHVIHEEGLQLSHLVDGMFDFLQLESGEAAFTSEPLDGEQIVQSIVAGFTAKAHLRHIVLDVVFQNGVPKLLGDRRRLEQVVRHLVDNAIKFTPDGGRVRVTLGTRDDGWEMRIEDSGPGVPQNARSAVFDKFHQLRDHLTEKPQGTGLGLATSRAIVARFGGLIWCEDSELGGAAFVVLLPGLGQPRLAAIAAGTGAGGGF
ncbi:MAG: PAS domain-containing sensor histidine kinase [Planctomycetes bacterium]|nr:PAS domain-containing sensor histidine kinase [Planctomycetota bacterium]